MSDMEYWLAYTKSGTIALLGLLTGIGSALAALMV